MFSLFKIEAWWLHVVWQGMHARFACGLCSYHCSVGNQEAMWIIRSAGLQICTVSGPISALQVHRMQSGGLRLLLCVKSENGQSPGIELH